MDLIIIIATAFAIDLFIRMTAAGIRRYKREQRYSVK